MFSFPTTTTTLAGMPSNEGQTHRNLHIAEEDIHNVAVLGRDGAAQTNLQATCLGLFKRLRI